MNAEQLRMALAMLEITVQDLAGRAGVSRGTIMRMTAGLAVMPANRAVIKSFLEGEDVVFIEATDYFNATIARRR